MKLTSYWILITVVVFLVGCGKQQEEKVRYVWHGLPRQYGIPLVQDEDGAYLLSGSFPERRIKLSREDLNTYTSETEVVFCYIYPELTRRLRDNRVVVSNAITAADMRHMICFCQSGGLVGPFWVNSVVQTGNQWIVVDKYWGLEDDAHRCASKVLHHIFTDDQGALTNIVQEIHFRLRKW